ncbi:MAG: D-glycero-beta-D-manno-heptose 1-phosphate adenylyltransferase [bacterium]
MICNPDKISELSEKFRKKRKKVVFTNGCFDIIHPGHIHLLSRARVLGDVLVVGLNSTASVAALKAGRPVNGFTSRAKVLDALRFVDVVCGFGGRTPIKLIKKVKPDVLVKGGDWKKEDVVGGAFVKSYGGEVKIIPYKSGFSTTKILKKVKSGG